MKTPGLGECVEVDAALHSPGLRLVVTRGIPGPWGEAAKGILHIKRIEHLRVSQYAGEANEALVAWTGINSAPIAVWNDEPPRAGWEQILLLAERLQPAPPLIPTHEEQRIRMFGLAHELCSEDGFGWNRRLMFFAQRRDATGDAVDDVGYRRMSAKYGYGREVQDARARLIAILHALSATLLAQRAAGARYYIGDRVSALDVYSACFMAMMEPLPQDACAIPPSLRAAYEQRDPAILGAADPILLEHRDFMYATHLETPLRL